MFPSLHQRVADAVANDIPSIQSHEKNSDKGSDNAHPTNIVGKFICTNKACSTGGWHSMMVAILIRGYPSDEYNAVVFNQRCKACKRLGLLFLDEETYVERVAYRLKKWAGVLMDRPFYEEKQTPPHESDLCEGCKRGFCRRANGRTSFVDHSARC